MERMRFTSRLTPQDICLFLARYGGFMDCVTHQGFHKNSKELIMYFSRINASYKIYCEDFSMRIVKIIDSKENSVAEIKPSADDWFCFLKGKFGNEYTHYYARLFKAEDLILEKPQYINRISFNEFVIVIKNLLGYIKNFDSNSIKVIEVESFFQSERRFFIESEKPKKSFYMRVSDYQIIQPRALSFKFRTIMSNMYGQEYINDYNSSLKGMISSDINIKEFGTKDTSI